MIKEILSDLSAIKSSKKELREFGITMFVVLGAIALYVGFKKKSDLWTWWAGASAFFFFWGLVWPAFLRPLQKIWMGLAVFIGFFMSRVILFVLYFFAVTPMAILIKCTGKDLLSMKAKTRTTYWQDHVETEITKEAYERQY